MINIKMSATPWLAFACRDLVRLADGPAKPRQDKSARRQEPSVFAHARNAAATPSALVYVAASELPTQQITKGGLRGPHPWRDVPVIT
ncbi:hypothetical protein [Nonomuraea aurantiaca]|uniref:hypothetical protein n=1 Tax=Nonomuraea aurantiaca TaxID=2878562 RepID=UPI001CDA1F54|nr:hypothetical protein [Nonomuraea aurantiaca]MCA2227911.1 hypothetical protein [Nonomuraea aurantiaca]